MVFRNNYVQNYFSDRNFDSEIDYVPFIASLCIRNVMKVLAGAAVAIARYMHVYQVFAVRNE